MTNKTNTLHTQGRLTGKEGGFICDANGVSIAATLCSDIAVARRFAACWNAFHGIPTEQFEDMDVATYVSDRAFLVGLHPATGGANLGLKGEACQVLADSFAGQFVGNGAITFLEVNLTHPKIGDFTVTMQKADGLTPGQMRAQAEAERDELKAINAELLAKLENLKDAIEFTPLGVRALQALKMVRIAIAKAKGGAA